MTALAIRTGRRRGAAAPPSLWCVDSEAGRRASSSDARYLVSRVACSVPAAGGVLLLPVRERGAAVVRLGRADFLRGIRRAFSFSLSSAERHPERESGGQSGSDCISTPAGVDGCCRSEGRDAAGTPKYVDSPPLLRRASTTPHLSTVPGTQPGFVPHAASRPCAPVCTSREGCRDTEPNMAVRGRLGRVGGCRRHRSADCGLRARPR